jgi:Uma2 family endonuclease
MATVTDTPPTSPPSERVYTPEDLLRMEDGDRYELIDGKLEERAMGAESSEIAANVIRIVGNHVHTQKLGKLFAPDCGYQIFPGKPNKVRFMDGSFIARGRLPEDRTPRGHMKTAPDLAVEVVSPKDKAEKVEIKRQEYLEAGVKLLWIIYPAARCVYIYRLGGGHAILGPNDDLTGEDVLPGFACKVAQLFEEL